VTPVDDLGEPVPLTGPPKTVVSLVPSLTEAIAESAAGLLVGATDYCIHPADLDVTRVGGSKYPKVDRVLDLRPDLVVANSEENRPQDVARLRADGIPVWVTEAPATVPAGLASVRRLLTQGLGLLEPPWLVAAEDRWRETLPLRATAIVPVWRKPWVVVGRDTFGGDVLLRLGIGNAYAAHEDRYPRPPLHELIGLLEAGKADLVVLPDEPYEFTETDGPEAFPGARHVLVSGRDLTWYGPSLVDAWDRLSAALDGIGR
jgi:ABC-type Fe3+-hydroxamate transport system substrate-binding protein